MIRQIEEAKTIYLEGAPGMNVIALQPELRRGAKQIILVSMDPGALIPLHTHEVDAVMTPVHGKAMVLSMDEDNGKWVQRGDEVVFRAQSPHGFRAGPEGFSFVSVNGGIVDEEDEWDIKFV